MLRQYKQQVLHVGESFQVQPIKSVPVLSTYKVQILNSSHKMIQSFSNGSLENKACTFNWSTSQILKFKITVWFSNKTLYHVSLNICQFVQYIKYCPIKWSSSQDSTISMNSGKYQHNLVKCYYLHNFKKITEFLIIQCFRYDECIYNSTPIWGYFSKWILYDTINDPLIRGHPRCVPMCDGPL